MAQTHKSYVIIPLKEIHQNSGDVYVTLPDGTYLPKSIPNPNNITFKTLLSHLDLLQTQPTTVGTKNGNAYYPEVRQSRVLPDLELRGPSVNLGALAPLFPSPVSPSKLDLYVDAEENTREWDLHIYEGGSFFARHTDGKKDVTHIGTMLLFPPASVSSFVGGSLILYPRGEVAVRLEPSQFTDWTLVAFHLDVAHECTPVTQGRRVVFKTLLNQTREEQEPFMNPIPARAEDRARLDVNVATREYQKKIRRLEEKIAKYRQIITLLESNALTPRVQKILKKLEAPGDHVVLLSTSWLLAEPSSLFGEEAQLWNAVLDRWPYSTLQVLNYRHDVGDGSDQRNILYYDGKDSDGNFENPIPFRNPSRHSLGSIEDTESVYNDNTYDTVHRLKVLTICVQKALPFTL